MPVRKQGGESNHFVDYQETPVTIGFTHRPARKNAEAHRALELLEDYHAKLTRPQDKQLRLAIERVIRIFKSRLFQALLDQRTNNWLFINSIYQVPFLLIAYLYFVLRCGPQYMKNRSSYSLKTFMKFYNIFQIIANAWLVYEHIAAGWFTEIPLTCVPIDYSYKPGPYRLARTMWWLFLLKLVDLIETIIYVLRKKHNQISFLHVYHHVSNCVFSWIYTKYVAGGMTTFNSLLNCSVHVLMYTYYLLATFGPTIQKVINPIKPYITILQMVQFIVLIIYLIQTLFPSCPVPSVFGPVFIGNLIANLFLFYKFYRNHYIKSKNM